MQSTVVLHCFFGPQAGFQIGAQIQLRTSRPVLIGMGQQSLEHIIQEITDQSGYPIMKQC